MNGEKKGPFKKPTTCTRNEESSSGEDESGYEGEGEDEDEGEVEDEGDEVEDESDEGEDEDEVLYFRAYVVRKYVRVNYVSSRDNNQQGDVKKENGSNYGRQHALPRWEIISIGVDRSSIIAMRAISRLHGYYDLIKEQPT
ncbi:hypothetical protein Glove_132g125 [Diversispora epigaea]|uniref:Uncharacterized protein n=1 Tax=Diversispora epigaea TaxID=1348612 RepID=A0A397IXR8_9GLOM|nr:hypothetical protein Glove_132g125 [Diversispora epigaea]